MTKGEALYKFLSGFMTAYAATSVPKDVTFPYLTYNFYSGAWGDGESNITVDMWFYTDGEAVPNAIADGFSAAIGLGGKVLTYDGGAMWLKRGTPFCQSLGDADNDKIKRRYFNISVEYISNN